MFHFLSDKRGVILQSALEVFMTYGFRKTSMDDIARAAGVSRPALYQLFANKADIFRALSREMMERAAAAADLALNSETPFRQRLYDSIDHSILNMHRFIDQTPHGMELMGVNEEIGQDIEREWCDVMIKTIADGLRRAEDRGEITLSKAHRDAGVTMDDIAGIFMQAMDGMKTDFKEGRAIDTHVRRLVDFTAIALETKH